MCLAPPGKFEAFEALSRIRRLLRPARSDEAKNGYHEFTENDPTLQRRLEMMRDFLVRYTDHQSPTGWMPASLYAANAHERSTHTAKMLRFWTRKFIADPTNEDLPYHSYGKWTGSLLDKGELRTELEQHLISIGRFIKAENIVEYTSRPDVKEQYGIFKKVDLTTAQR